MRLGYFTVVVILSVPLWPAWCIVHSFVNGRIQPLQPLDAVMSKVIVVRSTKTTDMFFFALSISKRTRSLSLPRGVGMGNHLVVTTF